jgi:hypothetical protein
MYMKECQQGRQKKKSESVIAVRKSHRNHCRGQICARLQIAPVPLPMRPAQSGSRLDSKLQRRRASKVQAPRCCLHLPRRVSRATIRRRQRSKPVRHSTDASPPVRRKEQDGTNLARSRRQHQRVDDAGQTHAWRPEEAGHDATCDAGAVGHKRRYHQCQWRSPPPRPVCALACRCWD